jgi:uncharacterized protein YhhL (DUF1145 family)
MKQSVLVMWLVLLLGMLFGGGTIASISRFGFWALVVIHTIEFFVKKSVLEKAGGSMGQHYVQVLIYGLFHWKPLEEQQAGQASE